MKKSLLIIGIASIVVGILGILMGILFLISYKGMMDGTPDMYATQQRLMITFFVIGIVFLVLGILGLVYRGKMG